MPEDSGLGGDTKTTVNKGKNRQIRLHKNLNFMDQKHY